MWPALFVEALRWLKERLPQIATGFAVWVYERMKGLVRRERARADKAELENKYLENRNAVEQENAGKSDADIVRDAIREGERIKRG